MRSSDAKLGSASSLFRVVKRGTQTALLIREFWKWILRNFDRSYPAQATWRRSESMHVDRELNLASGGIFARTQFPRKENVMKVLRTPDARFENLPDYGFEPVYTTIRDADGTEIRIHSVDHGSQRAAPILLLHGEPSWSFLYRHMIRGLAGRGHRVVAPDLVGFGKSDKPAEQSDYTFERHVDWMSEWLETNDLREATIFGQDWGGMIGLRLLARFPDRFSRAVMGNTGLPIGMGSNEAFRRWLQFSQTTPTLRAGDIVNGGTVRSLTAEGDRRVRRALSRRDVQGRRAAVPGTRSHHT